MTRPRAFVVMRPRHDCPMRLAFADGLRRHGVQVDTGITPPSRIDMVVLWGVRNIRVIAAQRRVGRNICILERGYVGDRFIWTSVSFGGGLNGRGEFRGVRSDPARFLKHHKALLKPWRPAGGYALLIGQVPNDMSLAPVQGRLDGWYREAASVLAAMGHEVRFRQHPGSVKRGRVEIIPDAPAIGGTLEEALSGAGLVVTFNSNTAVESVLAGIPTVTIDPGSMAWPVTAHALDAAPARPDRERWAAELAWKQWTLDELASGECWAAVGQA